MDLKGGEFKSLDIEEQVQIVNDLIEQGYSVEKIRRGLGVNKNYIASRFKTKGYIRDKTTKLYIKTTRETSKGAKNSELYDTSKNIKEDSNINDRVHKLEEELENLKETIKLMNDKLKEINTTIDTTINTTNTNTTIDTTDNILIKEIKVDRFKGNKVTRSFKINEEVQKQFKSFCKAHSEYEVGDILATAILEYINKF